MPREKSTGAIVYLMEEGEPLYLLLHYPTTKRAKKEYWDFPKGHVEEGETEKATATREIAEETDLKDIVFIEGFRESIQYFFRVDKKTIFKTAVFFLAKTKNKDVKISPEHQGFAWLAYENALARLKFANARRLLKKAHRLLGKLGS
ncbi:MAG: NUDIX domain-containing protein [Candidatus Wildermuthbacteria bacterium]|nr:NUDIX domain-containing protein [Candidatus Wildermuthbacteria bacterium]